MAKKSVAKNYIYDLIYRILQVLTPLITAPYVSRVIGSDGIGDYSYTQAICSYFTLTAVLGSNVYGQREIAFCREDRTKRSLVFWEIMIIRFATILISGIAYIIRCQFAEGTIQVLLLLQCVDLFGLVFDVTWLIQGVEEFKIMLYRNLFIKFFSIAAVFLLIHSKKDLYLYVFLLSMAVVLGNVTLWPRLRQYISKPDWKNLQLKRHFLPIFSLFLPTVALRLHDSFDKVMLGHIIHSSDENGYYEQSRKIVTMAITIVTSLSNVMLPRMAALFAENNKEKLKEYLYNSFEVVWVLALPISFGLAAVSDNLVPWFFGAGYDKVAVLLKAFAPICLAMAVMNVIGLQYLVPTDRQRKYTMSIVIGTIANILMNAVMIPYLASLGAVIASVLSETVIIAVQLFMIHKEIPLAPMFRTIPWKLAASALMWGVVVFLSEKLSSSIFHTAVLTGVGGIIYLGILFLVRDSSIMKVMDMVKGKLQRKK